MQDFFFEVLQRAAPEWEAAYSQLWVAGHAQLCSAACASTVAIDADLKIRSLACVAELGKERVEGTTLRTPRFCGNFTLGHAKRLCTQPECRATAEALSRSVEQSRLVLQHRYNKSRAAPAGPSGHPSGPGSEVTTAMSEGARAARDDDDGGAAVCFPGDVGKRALMEKRRLRGTMGVMGCAFLRCGAFGDFQRVFRSESYSQCVRFLSSCCARTRRSLRPYGWMGGWMDGRTDGRASGQVSG